MHFLFDKIHKIFTVIWICAILFCVIIGYWLGIFICLWFGFIIWGILNTYKHYFKLLKLGESIRREPSNKKVKGYIDYIESRKAVVGAPSIWGSLRETYRQISELEGIDYDLKVQLFEALRVKGTRGFATVKIKL